jgi:hypothetical protein
VLEDLLLEEVAKEAFAGQQAAEDCLTKRGGLLEADGPRVDKAQSSCIGIPEESPFLQ